MAKLTILALLLVALLAASTEASSRATVTTATVEGENPLEQQSRCRFQGYGLRYCRRYLSQSSPYLAEEEEEEEEDNQQYQQTLRQCCQELRNVDEACRCEALRYAVRQQQQQEAGGYGGGYGGQGMLQRARSLPRYCNLRPQQCQFYPPAEAEAS